MWRSGGALPHHPARRRPGRLPRRYQGGLRRLQRRASCNLRCLYRTQVVYVSKDITITGGYVTANWSTPDPSAHPTVLDAGGWGRVFLIREALTVVLEGLRIANGLGVSDLAGGGGGVATSGKVNRLTIRNCDITNNTGTGLYTWGDTVTLENNRIVANSSENGSGGVAASATFTLTLTDTLFQDNVGESGGGARVSGHPTYLAYNTFQGNTGGSGGGLYVGLDADLILGHNSFLSNTATGYGGGLYADIGTGHAQTMTWNLFEGNVAGQDNGYTGGGAWILSSPGARLVFSHNRVLNNIASRGTHPSRGGGLYVSGPAWLLDNLFQGNWANTNSKSAGDGGGLYVVGPAWLERNRILDNRASQTGDWGGYYTAYGGGLYILRGVVTMTNNIVAGNLCCVNCWSELFYTDGDGIYLGGQTSPDETQLRMYHNTLADNGINAIRNESAAITMSHTIFSGQARNLRNTAREGGFPPPSVAADYTLWYPAMKIDHRAGTLVHTHDFTGTPDFVSTPLDNYHLGPASQAIDRGPGAGITTDIDGQLRPVGVGYDLGADEYTGVDLSRSGKTASPLHAAVGQTVTFSIVLRNSGPANAPAVTLSDAIPTSTTYLPGSARATGGVLTDRDGIAWTGTIASGAAVTITFQVTVNRAGPIQNTAVAGDGYGAFFNLTAWVNQNRLYLPLVVRHA